ncbi:MAG: ABC transporter permease [Caldilineaceae bacterium]|nr:ABC transporter permease [Caldilineaceae bacterium]
MVKFIVRRLLMTIPTLIAIAIVSFALIQLPPGDFMTSYIAQLESTGTILDDSQVASLRERYGLDQPIYEQFLKWSWNMLHGDFGVSFLWNKPVNELIWERLGLTFIISITTLMFTWVVALPIGVYSAVKQYSVGDYAVTFVGFLGRGIPDFMLALVLMYVMLTYFGISAGGLFSLEYRDAAWSWGKVWDLIQHLWVPIIVLGTSSTAGLIRITRNNLLDELHKPYVETARAKGVSEWRLLWKYPVRLALNPFISTVGWVLPTLISGSTIVSVVLSLPTTGPLLLNALLAQDMYLAGSFLFILSVFTVIGTLISDILLAWLDPRIRTE